MGKAGLLTAVFALIAMWAVCLCSADWTNMGTVSAGAAKYVRIIAYKNPLDGADVAWVSYQDAANGKRAAVKRLQSGSWVDFGPTGISTGQVSWITGMISYDDNSGANIAYGVVYAEGNAVVMMRGNGTAWSQLGSTIMTSSSITNVLSTITNESVPIVAVQHAGGITVKKLNGNLENGTGTVWSQLGSDITRAADSYSIERGDDDGKLYIALGGNDTLPRKPTVLKYNGSEWVLVGPAEFYGSAVGWIVLRVPLAGPTVVFQDSANGFKATAMRFSNGGWSVVGTAGFTPQQADAIAMRTSGSTIYMSAFCRNMTVMVSEGGAAFSTYGNSALSHGDEGSQNWLAIAQTLWIAFTQSGHTITVMKYVANAPSSGANVVGIGTASLVGLVVSVIVSLLI